MNLPGGERVCKDRWLQRGIETERSGAWHWPGFTHLPINHHVSCSWGFPLPRPPPSQPSASTTASGSGPAGTPALLQAAHGPWVHEGPAAHDPLSSPGRGVWGLCSLSWAQARPGYPNKSPDSQQDKSQEMLGRGGAALGQCQSKELPSSLSLPMIHRQSPSFRASGRTWNRRQGSGLGFIKDNPPDLGHVPEPFHVLYHTQGGND